MVVGGEALRSALDRMQLSKIPSAGKTNSSDAAIYSTSLKADLEWQNYVLFSSAQEKKIDRVKESTCFDYKAPIAILSLSKTQAVQHSIYFDCLNQLPHLLHKNFTKAFYQFSVSSVSY